MRLCSVLGRRVFLGCLFGALLAAPAAGQSQEQPAPGITDLRTPLPPPAGAPIAEALRQPMKGTALPLREHKRPAALLPLYISFAGLQGLDIHSSRRGMKSGATREGNPLMRPFVGNDVAFIAIKACATLGTILVTEKLRKKRPKTAVVLAVAFNVGMAAVVAHNYRIARR